MKTTGDRTWKHTTWLKDVLNNHDTILEFPTCFQSALKLNDVLRNPDVDQRKIITAVSADPLMAARVVHLANTAAYYRGSGVIDVATAVSRIGSEVVNRLAISIALKQLSISKEILEHYALSRTIWHHSLLSASAAFVISKEYGDINPFEAEFAGLISNIGAFYILYKAATYPPVSRDPVKVKRFINQHHEEAGLKILKHLDMPIDLMDAVETSPLHSVGIDRVPRSMREVVHIARSIADEKHPWRDIDNRPTIQGSLFGELEELIEYRRNENTAIYE